MKRDSDELFQLIAVLTPAEKRYCSLYLKKNATGNSRYLTLFNYMKEESRYNAARIIELLRYGKKTNHYAVLKKQLHGQLLDALHQFSLFSNPRQRLIQEISQCNLLLQKKLVAQCEKKIAAVQKKAIAMDDSIAQLMIQNLKLSVMSVKRFRQVTDDDLADWEKNTLKINRDLQSLSRYSYLNSWVAKMNYESGTRSAQLTARIKAIIDLPEFSDEKNAGTVHTKDLFYQTRALYHFHNLENQKAMYYLEKTLQLLENSPHTNLFVKSYQSVLYNYLLTCLELKKYSLFETGLLKLRNLPELPAFKRFEKSHQGATVFFMSHTLELDYLMAVGRFGDAYLKVPQIKKGFVQYAERVPKRNRITLHTMMAYICFAMAKYNDALEQVIPIIQEKESAVAEDIQLLARILQLLCHFEKGDNSLVNSLVKSLQRSIRQKDESGDVLRAVLTFVNSSLRRSKTEHWHWREFQKKLGKLLSKRPPEGISNLLEYNVWVRSHTDGITFSEAWNKEPHG